MSKLNTYAITCAVDIAGFTDAVQSRGQAHMPWLAQSLGGVFRTALDEWAKTHGIARGDIAVRVVSGGSEATWNT